METKKTGFVAIVGKPNVGKSSLLNALLGQKISIASPKPQTTRNKVLGIINSSEYQIVFVDTPGSIRPRTKLDEFMKGSIESALEGIDALVIVLDGTKIDNRDFELIESFAGVTLPIFVIINKTDISKYEKVYPNLAKLNDYKFVTKFLSLSAKTGENVKSLVDALVEVLPTGIPLFDEDAITDKSERFLTAEIIREKALLLLQEEIPHGIAVFISKFEDLGKVASISAEIVVNKPNHKPIVIGRGGSMLKKIGTLARIDIEELLGKRVNLETFVKVREGWQNNTLNLRDFGYDKKDI